MAKVRSMKPTRDSRASGTLERVARGEHVILRRGGKAVAALVSIEDLRLLEESAVEGGRRNSRGALRAARKTGTIQWSQLKAEFGLK